MVTRNVIQMFGVANTHCPNSTNILCRLLCVVTNSHEFCLNCDEPKCDRIYSSHCYSNDRHLSPCQWSHCGYWFLTSRQVTFWLSHVHNSGIPLLCHPDVCIVTRPQVGSKWNRLRLVTKQQSPLLNSRLSKYLWHANT